MFLFLSKRDWKLQLFSSGIFFRYTMFFSDVWCAFSWIFFFFYNISNFVIALRKLRIFILATVLNRATYKYVTHDLENHCCPVPSIVLLFVFVGSLVPRRKRRKLLYHQLAY